MDFNELIAEAKREEQEYHQQYRVAYVAAGAPTPPPRPTKSNCRYISLD